MHPAVLKDTRLHCLVLCKLYFFLTARSSSRLMTCFIIKMLDSKRCRNDQFCTFSRRSSSAFLCCGSNGSPIPQIDVEELFILLLLTVFLPLPTVWSVGNTPYCFRDSYQGPPPSSGLQHPSVPQSRSSASLPAHLPGLAGTPPP